MPAAPAFSGAEAMRLIEKQVSFGPRIPGSAGHAAMLEWLVDELEETGARVARRPFRMTNALTGENVTGTNVVASFGSSRKDRIFFAAHWDTRAWADQDPDSTKRREPVPGANDGGSGVAILLQLARIIEQNPPGTGIDLLFFDGED
ncbi:MAG: M28 family peptidase, partial [Gemmatimonadetes bacterium]|nr:M28 family peptidase [Gemmatimonadota bacterium]